MIAPCQDDERFRPGMVLQVTHSDQLREDFFLNDPGPPPASSLSNKERAIVDVIAALEATEMDEHSVITSITRSTTQLHHCGQFSNH